MRPDKLTLLLLVLAAAPAVAQTQPPPDPVETARMRFGPLGVTPSVSLTNVGVDTNVFNTVDNPQRDFTATLAPQANAWFRAGRSRTTVEGRLDLAPLGSALPHPASRYGRPDRPSAITTLAAEARLCDAVGVRDERIAGQGCLGLNLHAVLDDRAENCLDVATESKARPFLIWRGTPDSVPPGAKRLGIDPMFSIVDALEELQQMTATSTKPPKLLSRLRNAIGI